MKNLKVLALTALVFTATLSPMKTHASLNDYFVGTEWLSANKESVKIVDVRATPLYLLGHIDGALNIDKREFLSKRDNVKSLVPTLAEFEALMTKYGITPLTKVVAYAEDDNPYAARFVWMLRYHGHSNSYVLDGGYDKWSLENRPTTILPTQIVSVEKYKGLQSENIRANSEDILTRLNNPSVVIWDTRRTSEFNGQEVRADRGGHIPGATHFDWVNLQQEVNGVKVLKSKQQIIKLLAEHGITKEHQIIAHCQTGIRSSYATLVLLGLGFKNVQNYDGSWIEWANNSSLPIIEPIKVAKKD